MSRRHRKGISIVEADPNAIVGVPASNIESAVTQEIGRAHV